MNMSILGSYVIIFLLLIRFILKKWLSKSVVVILWLLPLLRLLIPVTISSPLSFMNYINQYMMKVVPIKLWAPIVAGGFETSFSNSIQLVDTYQPMIFVSYSVQTLFQVLGFIWIIGTSIAIIIVIISYIFYKKLLKLMPLNRYEEIIKDCNQKLKLKHAVKCYESDILTTPILLGIINSKVILPINMNEDLAQYVLIHEISHIKRKDNLRKLIYLIVACMHWFNPFSWLMVRLLDQDIELACDEKVLKLMPKNKQKGYALALLDFASKKPQLATGFSSSNTKHRIQYVLAFKRLTKLMTIITAFLMTIIYLLLIILLLTNSLVNS